MLLGKLGDHVLSDSSFVYSKASRVSGGGSARMVEEGEGGRGSGRRGGSGSGSGRGSGSGSGSGSGPLPRPAIILNPQSWYTSRPSSVCLHLLLHLLRHLLRHLLLRIFYFSLCFTSASDSTYQTLHPPCPIGSTSCIVALQPQITTSVTTERGGIARAARHPQQPRCATLSPSRSKHHKIYFCVGP